MNELDENGWAHIHHAAYRGFVKSVERFVKANEDQLEMETGDDLHSTPLLLAVMSGNLETVETLVELGAKVWMQNTQNHGVVELCAFKQFIPVLEYFIKLKHEKLQVWKNLIKFMGSDIDDECEAAAKCLRTLTESTPDGDMSEYWKPAFDHGLIPADVKVIKSGIGESAKVAVQYVLLNMLPMEECKAQCVSSGGMPPLIKHLKSTNNNLIQLSAECIRVLATNKEYADQAAHNGAIPALVKVVQTIREPSVLVEVIDALGTICQASSSHQDTFLGTQGAVRAVVDLFEDCVNKPLQMALTRGVSQIVGRHEGNQCAFVKEGVATKIIPLVRVEAKKHLDLQLGAVESISKLAEENPSTQRTILEAGVVSPLLRLLKRSRQQEVQEKTACALWSLAGDDVEERRCMAEAMDVPLLNEFLSSLSEDLHFIGSEGLGVLAQGPLNKQDDIARANGVQSLVRLLRSDKEYIVLNVIRTIRYLCVGVGYVPHFGNQNTVSSSRGIKFLVALMVHSKDQLIQVEAAHTLAAAALGNAEILEEIHQNIDFSYVRLLKMMYAQDEMVRLLAGAALAAFAFNSLQNQKDIAEQGGIRFSCFKPFLQSDDEFCRCLAAFQVVVLARIIPDEEQAISSAAGIKLLVDLLHNSKSDVILALTADCISRLAHTRAGVPSAFISIDCVNLLCDLLEHQAEQVRGCAAITLGYLSYDHQAKRQILNRCRTLPYLMKILTYYTSNGKLNPEIADGWQHYKQIGLPKIDAAKTALVGRKTIHYTDKDNGRPHTITSFDETGGTGSTTLHGSQQQLHAGDGASTGGPGRSSRGESVLSGSRSTATLTPRGGGGGDAAGAGGPRGSVMSSGGGAGGPSGGKGSSRRTSVLSGELPPEIGAEG